MTDKPKFKGFAAMTPEKRREAGRKGGQNSTYRAFAVDRELASRAGSKSKKHKEGTDG